MGAPQPARMEDGSKEVRVHLKELRNGRGSGVEERSFKICFPGGIERKIYEALGFTRTQSYFVIVSCAQRAPA